MIVLGGVDGSERSYHAMEFVSRLLSASRDQFVLYCSPRKVVDADVSVLGAGVPQRVRRSLAEEILAACLKRLPETFQAHTTHLVGDAKPVDGILVTADEVGADLIVVGAHGATRRRPLFPGGVARGVAHRAEVPVLMVRETTTDQPQRPLRVMLAHCRTAACNRAITVLNQFTWPPTAEGWLLHVVDALDPAYVDALERNQGPKELDVQGMLNDYRQHLKNDTQKALQDLRAAQVELPTAFHSREPLVVEGQNVEQIIAAVEQQSIDLLVVGARSLSAIGRYLSSTTESLMLHCPCSMLIVHARATPAEHVTSAQE